MVRPLPFPPHHVPPRRVGKPGLDLYSFALCGQELHLLLLPSGPGQALPACGAPPLGHLAQLPLEGSGGSGPSLSCGHSVAWLWPASSASPHFRLTKSLGFLGVSLLPSRMSPIPLKFSVLIPFLVLVLLTVASCETCMCFLSLGLFVLGGWAVWLGRWGEAGCWLWVTVKPGVSPDFLECLKEFLGPCSLSPFLYTSAPSCCSSCVWAPLGDRRWGR